MKHAASVALAEALIRIEMKLNLALSGSQQPLECPVCGETQTLSAAATVPALECGCKKGFKFPIPINQDWLAGVEAAANAAKETIKKGQDNADSETIEDIEADSGGQGVLKRP